MFAKTTLLQALLFQAILGDDYCSSNIEVKANCVPCSKLCPKVKRPCHSIYSFCPKQCGHAIAASKCSVLCHDNCLDGRCEYTHSFIGLNCLGCKPEFTGQMCQDVCDTNCLQCDQYNSTICIECKENYRPPDCSELLETTSAMPSTMSTVDISLRNCSSNCSYCNLTSGDCTECPQGKYGRRCESVCTHCNASLCGTDMNCIDCIRFLNTSECVTVWTELETTTMSNCTDPDCHHTLDIKSSSVYNEDTLKVICGILAVVVLTFGIIGFWRKVGRRYQLIRVDVPIERQANSDQDSSGRLAGNPGYIYIDDNELDQYYSGLNENRTRPPRCRVRGHYTSIENQDVNEDVECGSTLSSTSETIFGNLFEMNAECHDDTECNLALREPFQETEKDYASAETYEMSTFSYLTPELPATR